MNKKIIGVVVAVLVFGGIIALKFAAGAGIGFLSAKADAPEVGECVLLTGNEESAEVDAKACGDDVLWKVVADDGNCDAMAETNYFVEVAGKEAVSLCLAYDLAVGECFESVTDSSSTLDKPIACNAKPAANALVLKTTKVDTTSAAIKCGKKAVAIPNKSRNISVCVAPLV